jgi:hypothetical protein
VERLDCRLVASLQHGDDGVVGARRQVDDARDRVFAILRVAVVVRARIAIGADVLDERRPSGLTERARRHLPRALVLAPEERNLEARHVLQILRERIVDLVSGDDPRHRQRRHHWNDGELIELPGDRRKP